MVYPYVSCTAELRFLLFVGRVASDIWELGSLANVQG